MSTYTIYHANLAVSSAWTDGAEPAVETRYRDFALTELAQDAVVTQARLSAQPWGEAQTQTMNGSADAVQYLPVDSIVPGRTLRIAFVFQGKSVSGQESGVCTGGWRNITLEITYQIMGNAVGAPGTVSLALLSNTAAAHTLTVSIGDFSEQLSLAAGSESASFTPPLAWLAAMPDTARAPLRLALATAGGGTIIRSLLLCCPESQAPAVSGAVCVPASEEVPESWQVYVAGKSRAAVSLSVPAQAAYGASIVRYEITGCGAAAAGKSLPLSARTALLPAGEQHVVVSAVDSRGLRGSQTLTIPVCPYSAPEIFGASASRRDADGQEADEGTYIRVAAQAQCAPCGGENSVSCAVAYRPRNAQDWVYAGNLAQGTLLFGDGQMDIARDYDIRLLATDAFGAQTCHYLQVPRAQFALHFRKGGKGAAFFGPAGGENTLRVYGNLQLDGALYGTELFSYDGETNTLTIRPYLNTFSFDAETGVLSITDAP